MPQQFLNRIGLVIVLFWTSAVMAQPDDLFLDARDAFRLGRRSQLETLTTRLKAQDHLLVDYAEYYLLRQGLEKQEEAPVQAFIQQHEKDWLGERLRADWLKVLVMRKDWAGAARHAALLVAPDQESRCLALLISIKRKQPEAMAEGQSLWRTLKDNSEGCQFLLQELETQMATEQRWERIRFLYELNDLKQARRLLLALPQPPDARQLDTMLDNSASWLARLAPEQLSSRTMQGLTALALQRLARNDPSFAASQMPRWGILLESADKNWVWGQIGLQGALRHLDSASLWFSRSLPAQLSHDGAEWQVRAALRRQDWNAVRIMIEMMPPELKDKPEWIYWLGRAYKTLDSKENEEMAQALFSRLSGQASFYGNLADEELGRAVTVPPLPLPVQPAELTAMLAHPGLERALALFRLDLRLEALREWNWSVRAMNDRELLAAAELAQQYQIYDRAIHTADRTKQQHDYRVRYLAPFLEQVRPIAHEQGLDNAWVYGLMRQESRFVIAAKSSAGASGLMQLMPATARWVAKKIGLKDYNPGRVHDPEINLRLGTAYMRMVMESLDEHPVLASAAYNAGPGRARRWKAEVPLEGAIYAETIPFDETRDYVKKVMSNTLYYALLFNGKSASLHARLGTIPQRSSTVQPIALP